MTTTKLMKILPTTAKVWRELILKTECHEWTGPTDVYCNRTLAEVYGDQPVGARAVLCVAIEPVDGAQSWTHGMISAIAEAFGVAPIRGRGDERDWTCWWWLEPAGPDWADLDERIATAIELTPTGPIRNLLTIMQLVSKTAQRGEPHATELNELLNKPAMIYVVGPDLE